MTYFISDIESEELFKDLQDYFGFFIKISNRTIDYFCQLLCEKFNIELTDKERILNGKFKIEGNINQKLNTFKDTFKEILREGYYDNYFCEYKNNYLLFHLYQENLEEIFNEMISYEDVKDFTLEDFEQELISIERLPNEIFINNFYNKKLGYIKFDYENNGLFTLSKDTINLYNIMINLFSGGELE